MQLLTVILVRPRSLTLNSFVDQVHSSREFRRVRKAALYQPLDVALTQMVSELRQYDDNTEVPVRVTAFYDLESFTPLSNVHVRIIRTQTLILPDDPATGATETQRTIGNRGVDRPPSGRPGRFQNPPQEPEEQEGDNLPSNSPLGPQGFSDRSGDSRVIARGDTATLMVTQLLLNAHPLVWDNDTYNPGTIWAGDRMFVSLEQGEVIVVQGNRLLGMRAGLFIQQNSLQAMSEGARTAEWWDPAGRAVMTLTMSFMGAFVGLIGTAASIVVTLAKLAVFYETNKESIDRALPHLSALLDELKFLHDQCPDIFWLILRTGAWDSFVAGQTEFTLADAADLLGKLLGKGLRAGSVAPFTIRALLKVVVTSVAVSRGIRGGAHAFTTIPRRASALRERLQREDVSITEEDAQRIATSDCWTNLQVQQRLESLHTHAVGLGPLLDGLEAALLAEQAPNE